MKKNHTAQKEKNPEKVQCCIELHFSDKQTLAQLLTEMLLEKYIRFL